MTAFWIDIENAFGAKLGAGPITSALNWQHTANMDRAGVFAFTMPVDDPRRVLLALKRVARCWTAEGGRLRHLGAGIINDVRETLGDDNAPLLTVSGEDLLTELLNRIIPRETLNETQDVHPARAGYNVVGIGLTYSQAAWIDLGPGDATTWAANGGGDAVRVYTPEKFNRLDIKLHSSGMGGGTHQGGIAEYWDGAGWVEFALTENTTRVNGDWFAQSGYLAWADDAIGWPETREPNYQVRFRATTLGWLGFTPSDVTVRVTRPTAGALAQIMTYAPAGWQLDAGNGYTATAERPLVDVELLANGGFESYTGTPNDAATDAWPGWAAQETPEHFAYVQAVTSDKHGGAAAVKLTTGSTYGTARISQIVAVEPSTEYTLRYWTRGDGGSGQTAVGLLDADLPEYDARFFYQDSGVTGAAWAERRITFTTSAGCNNLRIDFWNPWALNSYALVDDASLLAGGGAAIALESIGQTVLENLIRVSETTGEHFIASPNGRMVLWLGHDARSSGVRVTDAEPLAAEAHSEIALIAGLTQAHSGADLVSRVYPYGGGREPIPTLRNTTRHAPAGYTLDKTANCLIRNQAEAAYGRVERRLDHPDVTNVTGDMSGDVHSCNMLFDRAYAYLRRNSATVLTLEGGDAPRTYDLALLKCDRVILPGHTVRVQYDRYVEGARRLHIDADLWVLSSTVRVDENGVRTVALQCSTVDLAPRTDAELIAGMLRAQRAMQAYGTGAG